MDTCPTCGKQSRLGKMQCDGCGNYLPGYEDPTLSATRRRGKLRGLPRLLVWLVILGVGGYFGYQYGLKGWEWYQERSQWGSVAEGIHDPDSRTGDNKVVASIENIDRLGPQAVEFLHKEGESHQTAQEQRRCLLLLAYAATRTPLGEKGVSLLRKGLEDPSEEVRAWAIRGAAIAGAGEAGLAVLRPFPGAARSARWSRGPREREESARNLLEDTEPRGDNRYLESDVELVVSRAVCGDVDAMALWPEIMARAAAKRGSVVSFARELMFRVCGRKFEEPAEFEAWWEEGYKQTRAQWLASALESAADPEMFFNILQQLRALAGKDADEYKQGEGEEAQQKAMRHWQQWAERAGRVDGW